MDFHAQGEANHHFGEETNNFVDLESDFSEFEDQYPYNQLPYQHLLSRQAGVS